MKAVSNNTEATRFDDSILKDGRKEVISIYAIPDRKLGLFINLSVFIKLLRTKAMSRFSIKASTANAKELLLKRRSKNAVRLV